jgi:hypothetical protein
MDRIKWEVFADKLHTGDWRVEAIGNEGDCYVTIFSGPAAEERAKHYARFCHPCEEGTDRWRLLSDVEKITELEGARDGAWALYVKTLERLPKEVEE